jgi:hypothetical protein
MLGRINLGDACHPGKFDEASSHYAFILQLSQPG